MSKDISISVYLIAFLIFSIAILVLELNVTMNKPVAFGDSAYHAYISKLLGTTKSFPKILDDFGSYYNYSPLFHILSSVIFMLPSSGWVLIKAVVPFMSFLAGLLAFIFISKLYNERIAFVVSIIFLTLPMFVTYSMIIYTDVLMVLFFMLSFVFVLMGEKFGNKKYWLLAFVFASLCYLSKATGFISFIFAYSILFFKLARKEMKLKDFGMIFLVSILIFGLIVGWWWIRNYIEFKTVDCNLPMNERVFRNSECINPNDIVSQDTTDRFAGYVSSGGTNYGILQFGLNQFVTFIYGNIWLVPLLASCGIVLMIMRKERNDGYVLLLFLLTLIPAIFVNVQSSFTMRVEDVGRYMMLTSVPLALIIGLWLDTFFDTVKKFWKYLPILLMIFLMIMLWNNFYSKLLVMSQVTTFSPAFFGACDWIRMNTDEDSKFLSLWSAPTAYNCERKSEWSSDAQADMVLNQDVNVVLKAMQNRSIDYIFVQKFAISSTPYVTMIPADFVNLLESNPSIFVKVYENGLSLAECSKQGGCDGSIIYKVNQ